MTAALATWAAVLVVLGLLLLVWATRAYQLKRDGLSTVLATLGAYVVSGALALALLACYSWSQGW